MTQLYRHFDGAGTLLYVGIARNVPWRQVAHELRSGWFRDVRSITVSAPYRTRAEAYAAEIEAIRTERPKWNQQHVEDPVKPPVVHRGSDLLRRLKAKQANRAAIENDLAERAAAIAAIRQSP